MLGINVAIDDSNALYVIHLHGIARGPTFRPAFKNSVKA